MARPLDTGAGAAAADVSNAARAADTLDGAGAVAGAGAGADASNLDLRSLSFDILRGGQVANRERPGYTSVAIAVQCGDCFYACICRVAFSAYSGGASIPH